MKLKKFASAVALTASLASIGVVADQSPVDAAGCDWAWRSTSGNDQGRSFNVSTTSSCNDLNAQQPTWSQLYRGEYVAGGQWVVGSRGWLSISQGSTLNRTLLTDIANGTQVRVTGSSRDAVILVGT